MKLPKFVMTKHGDYAVYVDGEYSGYAIHRNGGDRFPTYVLYKGERVATVKSLDTAKNFVTGRVNR